MLKSWWVDGVFSERYHPVQSVDSECKEIEILKIVRSFSVIVFYEYRLNVKHRTSLLHIVYTG